MNTKNNKRRRGSVEKLQKAFVELLQTRELKEVSVSEICKLSGLNRSTFYANFLDVYDLADKIREQLEQDFTETFRGFETRQDDAPQRLFEHIRDNQLFYKTYFKLGYDEKHQVNVYDTVQAQMDFGNQDIKYHIEFFRNGLNAVIKLWLSGGCAESPEEMAQMLKAEYRGR